MQSYDFNKEFGKTRKKVRIIFAVVASVITLMFIGYIAVGFWTYNTVVDNGGVQKTATDIVRTIKQIDKDSDIK